MFSCLICSNILVYPRLNQLIKTSFLRLGFNPWLIIKIRSYEVYKCIKIDKYMLIGIYYTIRLQILKYVSIYLL